jgi:Sensors of blue-light using FAD
MPLERLIYVSQAVKRLGTYDVRLIAGQAAMLNRRKGMTGVLGFTGMHFLQALEGRSAQLDHTITSIAVDKRHTGVRVLRREPTDSRWYGQWDMHLIESLDAADEIEAWLRGELVDEPRLDAMLHKLALD